MAKRLRVYADREHYSPTHRAALNDILKAAWNDAPTEDQRIAYGNRNELFDVVAAPDDADIHLLTMKWPHYIEGGLVPLALSALEKARTSKKPFVVFGQSDFEANFPVPGDDIHIFQNSGYRSRSRNRNHGMPAFVPDAVDAYCGGTLKLRERSERAVVGFCGQGGSSLAHHAVRYARTHVRNWQWRLGLTPWEPAPFEHTWFRQRILDAFERERSVDAQFVVRRQYRAGIASAENRNDTAHQSRREFIDNVVNTDYTVCVRGGGNFSVRFYEALVLGRVPIFIDTDCVLPFDDRIAWRDYTVWIDARDAMDAPRVVASSHARIGNAEFVERQRECREIWKRYLSPDGFYATFRDLFLQMH